MSKRASGPPRRPRNPVARAVHTPQYRMRAVPDKRGRPAKPPALEELPEETSPEEGDRPDRHAAKQGDG